MLFVTGLLTLLAFANAEGDHIKGGVKGSASKQIQQITQEEPIPSPYNFAIKSAASYGTKIIREESGDAEGRVEGSYTIDGPRGTKRVVQYHADDSGFHANVKTSEPNIKTHSPSNAVIEAVPKDASPIGQSSQQIQGKIHHAAALYHASADHSEGDPSGTTGVKTIVSDGSVTGKTTLIKLREPTARPVKTIDSQGSSPAQVKGAGATKSFTVAQQQRGSLLYVPGAKDSSEQPDLENRIRELNRGLIQKQGEAGFLQTFTGGVDGVSFTSAELEDLSKRIGFGNVEEPKQPEQIQPVVVRTSPQQVPGSRRQVVPGPTGVSGVEVTSTQGENIRFTLGNDAGILSPVVPAPVLRQPVAVPVPVLRAPVPAPVVPVPFLRQPVAVRVPVLRAPVPAPVAPSAQVALGDDIIAINRELIQKQGQAGITQTFGGIVGTDGNLSGVTITDSELENLSKQIGFGSRAQAAQEPEKPKPARPAVVRTSPQQVPGSRRQAQVIPGISRVSGTTFTSTQGDKTRFTLGNDAGAAGIVRPVVPAPVLRQPIAVPVPVLRTPVTAPVAPSPQGGFGDGIIAINRQLIQTQGVSGVTQTFGGIVGTDGNLAGVTITDSELESLSKQIGFGSRAQAAQEPEKPRPARPAVVRTSPQQVPGSRSQIIPGRVSGTTFTSTQGENIRFTLGNDAGAAGIVRPVVPAPVLREPIVVPGPVLRTPVQAPVAPSPQGGFGDGIIAINRQLIQTQGVSGVTQTFGGIVGTDGNLAGVTITDSELENLSNQIGFGSRAQAAPAQRLARPAVVRTSPQQVPGSRRQVQVTPGISRVSGTAFTSTQGENVRFTLGNDAGIVRPAVTAFPVFRGPSPVQAPLAPVLRVPSVPVSPAPQGNGIIGINRELIQKQGEAGFTQTFGGIVGTDGNLAGVSITASELQDLSNQIRFGSRGQAAPEPEKPKPAGPSPARTSPQYVPGSRRQVIPGVSRVSGTTFTSTQGENIQFTLGNDAGQVKPFSPAVPSPALRKPAAVPVSAPRAPLPDNIIAINRQLIQTQGVSGISQTFGGIVGTDGNIAGVSITDSQLQDLSKQIGFGYRPQSAPEPVKPKPARPAIRTSPQQIPGSRSQIIPGVSGVSGTTFTSTQGENIRFTLGNDAGAVVPVKPISPAAPSPALRKPAPVPTPVYTPGSPSPNNIIQINRELIQKQGVSGLSQAFGGIIRTDGNLDGVSLTASDLENLSKQIGFGSRLQTTPEKPQAPEATVLRTSPQQVPGPRPAAPRPRAPVAPISTTQGDNIQFTLGTAAGASGLVRPASPAVRTPASPAVRASTPALRAPSPVVGAPIPAVRTPSSDNIIAINRGLIQKQGEAGLSQVLGRPDGDLSGVSLTASELEDLTKQIGFGSSGRDQTVPEPVRPSPARTSPQQGPGSRYSSGRQPTVVRSRGPQSFGQASRGGSAEDKQKQINQDQIEAQVVQETFDSNFPTASVLKYFRQDEQKSKFVPDFVVVDSPSDQQDNQLRVKLDDISDPSVQSQVLLGDFSEKYQQEKLPVEIPGYVPSPSFMAPFNYRVPSLRSLSRPPVQEQQRIEQVFV